MDEIAPPAKATPARAGTGRAPAALDAWSFIDVAQRRLGEFVPEREAAATALLMAVVRAGTSFVEEVSAQAEVSEGSATARPPWATYRVLMCLWLGGAMAPAQLAEVAGVSRASVSAVVNSLAAKDYVVRTPSALDRRSVLIELSDAGAAYIMSIYEGQHAVEKQWVSRLSGEESQQLVRLLGKLLGRE